MTRYNAKLLSLLYKMSQSTYHDYLYNHREAFAEISTKRTSRTGKIVQCKSSYNSAQMKFLIENVFGDAPEGYVFDGKTLIKQV